MSAHVFVYCIHDVQQEDHRAKCDEECAHEHVRVVALFPRQHGDDAARVEEHEESGDGADNVDHVLDAGGEGGNDGGDQEPDSDGGDTELLIARTEWARGVACYLRDKPFQGGPTWGQGV